MCGSLMDYSIDQIRGPSEEVPPPHLVTHPVTPRVSLSTHY